MKVCPVNALSCNEQGAVISDPKKCIVCKMCVQAWPLGNITFSPITRQVVKCDLCGGDPQCAEFCPSNAIQFMAPELPRLKAADEGKCILCGLCSRACKELGAGAITTANRGVIKETATPYLEPNPDCIGCASCGVCRHAGH